MVKKGIRTNRTNACGFKWNVILYLSDLSLIRSWSSVVHLVIGGKRTKVSRQELTLCLSLVCGSRLWLKVWVSRRRFYPVVFNERSFGVNSAFPPVLLWFGPRTEKSFPSWNQKTSGIFSENRDDIISRCVISLEGKQKAAMENVTENDESDKYLQEQNKSAMFCYLAAVVSFRW